MQYRQRATQRGVIAFTTPIIILLILILTTLLLDGARLYAAKKEMQSITNAAATAAAQFTQSCGSLGAATDLDDVIASAVADRWDGEGNISHQLGLLQSVNTTWQFEQRPLLQSNAVGIRYQREHPISLLLGSFGAISLESTAVAYKEVRAAMSVQGSAASLDSTESELLNLVLGGILGMDGGLTLSNVGFDALSQLLVDAERLVARIAELTGEPVASVLQTEVTADVVLQALADVSDAAGPAATALDELAAAAGSDTNIRLEDVIRAAGGGMIPPGSQIPVLGAINSTVLNVGSALPDVITIDLGGSGLLGDLFSLLSGLGVTQGSDGVRLEVEIDEAPGFVIAPARQDENGEWLGVASGADVTLRVIADLNASLLGLVNVSLLLPLELGLGAAEAELVAARCAVAGSNDVFFDVDVRDSLLGLSTDSVATLRTVLLGTIANVAITGDTVAGAEIWQRESFGPMSLHAGAVASADSGGTSSALSNAVSGLLNSLDLDVEVLGLPLGLGLGALTNALAALLDPVIQALAEGVLEPLVSALGLTVGGAQLTLSAPAQSAIIVLEEVDF